MKKHNGRYAAGINRELVRNAIKSQISDPAFIQINKSKIKNETGLSYQVVLKYVKEIQGGK